MAMRRYVPDGYDSSTEDELEDVDIYANERFAARELTVQEKFDQNLKLLLNNIQEGDLQKSLKILDDNKLPIDVKIYQDWTPLLFAASYGHDELTKTFVERGADVDQIKDEKSVLMHACNISTYNPNYKKVINIAKLLVEHKCDVNYKNNKRMTAYLYSARSGNVDVLKFLSKYCDTDVMDNQGWDALFYAVNGDHLSLVKYLLRIGMDSKKHDVRRNTPLLYARQLGFRKVEKLLAADDIQEKTYDSFMCENYDYKVEILNPRFMRDVNILLYGMNCGALAHKFQDSSMNLLKFLTLTKEDLLSLNITRPYQLNRILGGLYKFHSHPFKYKSWPHIEENSILTTYDVGFTMFTALRHFITMQATIKYLQINVTNWDDKALKNIEKLELQLRDTQKLLKQLKLRCDRWEKENTRVDLITYPVKQKTTKIVYCVPVITAISIFLYFKYRL